MPGSRALRAWVGAGVVAAAGLLGALGLAVRARSPLAGLTVPTLGPRPLTIVPGLHLLGGLGPSAAYAIETAEGLVLVDSGLERDASRLRGQLRELGLDRTPIRAVLLTHAHGDHCGGAQYLRAVTGAKVYAGQGDAGVLGAGEPREAIFSTFLMTGHATHPTTIDVPLNGGEMIAFGDARIEAIAAPGHTPGSICYLLRRGGLRALFAGDVIMMLRGDDPARTELDKPLGTYSAYLPPRYRGDAAETLATLRKLRALPVPDLLLPGHPRADRAPESPCLTQGRWEALLDRGIRDMEVLLARYRADGPDFLDDRPKELLPGLIYLGDRAGRAVSGLLAGPKFFVVDAPGGPGLAEFLEDRLRAVGLDRPASVGGVLLTSSGPEATSGLNDLVTACHPLVVAPPDGLAAIRALCPAGTEILPADGLAGRLPFDPAPIGGRDGLPIAYRLAWAGKTVVVTGRLPVVLDQEEGVANFQGIVRSREEVVAGLRLIEALRALKPDLWLPARPVAGQNANLYDDRWARVLDDNQSALELLAPAPGSP